MISVGSCGDPRTSGVGVGPLEMECQEVKQLECDAKLAEKVDEVGERIGGKVDAAKDELKDEIRELSRNVQNLSKRRGRGGRRRHSAARREMCMHCWNVAQKDTSLRYSVNTRMTHEAAFNRYRSELVNVGIDTVAAFRRIIHSTQSLESAQRRKRLDEQRDGTKSPPTKSFLRHRSLSC